MDSNHDIVPTLRLNGGVYMSFAADEIERLRARVTLLESRADTSLIPGAVPTHRCKVFGAYWRKWNVDGKLSWNLCSPGCGECCDNALMGEQIEALVPNAKVGAALPPAIREGVEAAFEGRDGWQTKIAAAVRHLPAEDAKVGGDEREAFEAWFEADAMPGEADWFKRETDEPDEYAYTSTHNAWKAWKARAALSADGGEDKRDAERYRLIRSAPTTVMRYGGYLSGQALDAQCDAIAANQAKGEAK